MEDPIWLPQLYDFVALNTTQSWAAWCTFADHLIGTSRMMLADDISTRAADRSIEKHTDGRHLLLTRMIRFLSHFIISKQFFCYVIQEITNHPDASSKSFDTSDF